MHANVFVMTIGSGVMLALLELVWLSELSA